MTLPVQIPLALKVRGIKALTRAVRELRDEMRATMASVQESLAALDAATTEIANDLADWKARLEAAIADKEAAVQDAVNGVLAEFDPRIEQLRSLGTQNDEPAPEPEPVPEEPAPNP